MKKNNTLLIIIVLVLAIIVVSIGIGLSVFNKTKTDSNGQQSITNNKDTVDVKVDLEKASNKLTEYFALYLKTNTTDSNLNNHPVGNLLLAALYNITGNLTESLTSLSKIFNIKGRILPFTEDNPILIAHTKDGSIIEGESKITKAGQEIDYIEYKNKVTPTKEVLNALKEADLIILGIGSLYTSIIPNLLSEEVKEVLKTSKAKKMYVCNIMSEHGETDNYKVSDCINKINSYVEDNFIDTVLVNNEVVPDNIKERYVKEQASPIETDYAKLKDLNVEILEDKLLEIEEDKVRHNPYRTALAIFNYIVKELE